MDGVGRATDNICINTPTPVIFFAPGWHNTTHASYETLLKFDAIVNEFSNKPDTKNIVRILELY